MRYRVPIDTPGSAAANGRHARVRRPPMKPPRRPNYRRAELRRLVHPDSIALVGASPREGSFGDRALKNLAGYDGRIHLINARYDKIGERPCHPSLAAL